MGAHVDAECILHKLQQLRNHLSEALPVVASLQRSRSTSQRCPSALQALLPSAESAGQGWQQVQTL